MTNEFLVGAYTYRWEGTLCLSRAQQEQLPGELLGAPNHITSLEALEAEGWTLVATTEVVSPQRGLLNKAPWPGMYLLSALLRRPAPTPRESESDVATRVRQTIAECLKLPLERVQPNHDLLVDLGVDSLDAIELELDLEDALGIAIPDAEVARLRTVAQVIAYAELQLGHPDA